MPEVLDTPWKDRRIHGIFGPMIRGGYDEIPLPILPSFPVGPAQTSLADYPLPNLADLPAVSAAAQGTHTQANTASGDHAYALNLQHEINNEAVHPAGQQLVNTMANHPLPVVHQFPGID